MDGGRREHSVVYMHVSVHEYVWEMYAYVWMRHVWKNKAAVLGHLILKPELSEAQ